MKLLELAKSPVAATIVHGEATLEQLKNQLRDYEGDVEHLIIFHKDEFDYQINYQGNSVSSAEPDDQS